jgi:hypothetical protein
LTSANQPQYYTTIAPLCVSAPIVSVTALLYINLRVAKK